MMLPYVGHFLITNISFCLIYNLVYYLVLFLATFSFYWIGFGRFNAMKQLKLPGPKPLPFIGHLLDLMKEKFDLHKLVDKYRKKYGHTFVIHLQAAPTVVISDPEVIKQVLVKEFTKFHDRQFFTELPSTFDDFLPVSKGERWKFIRGILTPSFTSGKMRPMAKIMNDVTSTMIEKCRSAADEGKIIDAVDLLQTLSLEAVLAAAFSIQAFSQTDDKDVLITKVRRALNKPKWINVVAAFPGAAKYLRYLPFGFSYFIAPLLVITNQIVKERKENGYHGKIKDLLQLMLDAQEESDKNGRRLTDNEVTAQAFLFILAGYETSSTTLALTCYHLAANQDVQDKLYEEIMKKIPNDDQYPDYDMVQNFEYLDMVISETLRLYPPGFALLRTCNEDCTIKGIQFTRGVNAFVPVYSIHRDEQHWKDPEAFDPERFSSDKKAARNPFTFLPFGYGPRNCIGMRFAQMEMKIALARLIKKFRLEVCKETVIPPKLVLEGTLTVRDPINLKILSR